MGRILIADDEAAIRDVLSRALEEAGHEVEAAADGTDALRSMRRGTFDLVVTDIVMPDKEGLEVIMDLRRDYPALKIIAISGGGYSSRGEYLEAACKLGADRTFAKPFSLRELIRSVDELLGDIPPTPQG